MTLKKKLLLAQLPLIVALLLIGIISAVTTHKIGETSQIILKDNFRSVLAVEKMKEALERIDSAVLLIIIEDHRKDGEDIIDEYLNTFEHELKIQLNNITEKGEKEATELLNSLWYEYKTRLTVFRKSQYSNTMKRIYFNEISPLFKKTKSTADRILVMNQDAIVQKSDQVRKVSRQTNFFLLASVIILAFLGITVSFFLTGHLVRPIGILSDVTRRIEEGDTEARANIAGSDEIARLGEDFDRMADSIARYRQSSLGELLLAREASQATINSINDPVFVFDISGNLLTINHAAEETFFSGHADSINNPMTHLDVKLQDTIEHIKWNALKGRGPYRSRGFEDMLQVSTPCGDMYFIASASPVYEIEGAVIGVTVVLNDISRFKRLNDLENNLVATVAHELKTPLTSLRMAIHICLEQSIGGLNEKQLDLLYASREDCERLQMIVDELLDLSRISLGKVSMNIEPVKVSSILESAFDRNQELTANREIKLSISYVDAGISVLADPDRIKIVFDNLITNAMKHTGGGGTIDLTARQEAGAICFEVTDSGVGIDDVHLPRLFEKFYRIEGDSSEGVGLGLSIVKDIITVHGGQVGVKSALGYGSTFWFSLPISA